MVERQGLERARKHGASADGGRACRRGRCPERILVLQEPLIRRRKPLAEADAMCPAQSVKPADVEQLSRWTIGLARVEPKRRAWMNHIPQRLGKLAYGEIFAGADVDVTEL